MLTCRAIVCLSLTLLTASCSMADRNFLTDIASCSFSFEIRWTSFKDQHSSKCFDSDCLFYHNNSEFIVDSELLKNMFFS